MSMPQIPFAVGWRNLPRDRFALSWAVQLPFRINHILTWGFDEGSTLHRLRLGIEDQLLGPVPMHAFDARFPFAMLERLGPLDVFGPSAPGELEQFTIRGANGSIAPDFIRTGLGVDMPAANVGHTIMLDVEGPASALVLCGVAIP